MCIRDSGFTDAPCQFKAVRPRHTDVSNDQVGLQFPCQLPSALTVRRFPDDNAVHILPREKLSQTLADKTVIIHNQDFHAVPLSGLETILLSMVPLYLFFKKMSTEEKKSL